MPDRNESENVSNGNDLDIIIEQMSLYWMREKAQ